MPSIYTVWLTCLVLFGVVNGAQRLDDDAVAKAIKAGETDKVDAWVAGCKAGAGLGEKFGSGPYTSGSVHMTGPFRVFVSNNMGRIALAAAGAKDAGHRIRVGDVPDFVRGDRIFLEVQPVKPGHDWGGGIEVPSPIKEVLLRSKATTAAEAESEFSDISDVRFNDRRDLIVTFNSDGTVERNLFKRTRADFAYPIDVVRGLPAGDLEIVVVTDDGDRKCTIRAKDRQRVTR